MNNSATNVSVGEQVWVCQSYNHYRRGPERGTVVKVGRKLVTISYGKYGEAVFRLEGGRINDSYGGMFFLTDEQQASKERLSAAVRALFEVGIEVTHRCDLSVDRLEACVSAVGSGGSPPGSGPIT